MDYQNVQKSQEDDNLSELEQKHVPKIEVSASFIRVKVGHIPHPMEDAHHIEWVELYSGDDLIGRREFSSQTEPEAEFGRSSGGHNENLKAVAKCNIHGIWQGELRE